MEILLGENSRISIMYTKFAKFAYKQGKEEMERVEVSNVSYHCTNCEYQVPHIRYTVDKIPQL